MAKSNTQQNQQNIYNFILITLINRQKYIQMSGKLEIQRSHSFWFNIQVWHLVVTLHTKTTINEQKSIWAIKSNICFQVTL